MIVMVVVTVVVVAKYLIRYKCDIKKGEKCYPPLDSKKKMAVGLLNT